MPFDDGFSDRQPETAAARAVLPRRINFVEPLEDVRQVLGRDARP